MPNFDEYKELAPKKSSIIRDSRWVNHGLRTLQESDGEVFFESRDPKVFPTSPDEIIHVVQTGELNGRFDILSAAHYQTVLLWHVLIDANEVFDPFDFELKGYSIRVPARRILPRVL